MSNEYRIEYIDGPGRGHYVIVIGNWEKTITQDEHADPFESELEASTWAMENL